MALPVNTPLHDWPVCGQIIDISTASVMHVAPGVRGTLVRAYVVLSAAITVLTGTITIKKGTTAIGTITITVAASGVGSIHEAVMTGSEADRYFADNEAIYFDNDGASTTTSIGRVLAVIRRT